MSSVRASSLVLGPLIAVALTSCAEPERSSPLPGPDQVLELARSGDIPVDLLFVVNGTNGTAEVQEVLGEQIRLLLEGLMETTDLHLGVISLDLGSGPYHIQTCRQGDGDDGVLQNEGRWDGCLERYQAADCEDGDCPWLSHSKEHPDDGSEPGNPPIWEDFYCMAALGTGGCGFEQTLESSYRALGERTAPGQPNFGFLREGSLLVIVYVTDEDDCSAADPSFYDPDRDDLGNLNVRCVVHEELLHPVQRYIDAFRALRPDEDRLIVAAIAGVPVDGRWEVGDPLEGLRALAGVDPENPNQHIKSCDTALGAAYAPARIAELVYAFGRSGFLASCCRSDWTDTLMGLSEMIQSRLVGLCLPPGTPADVEAHCRLVEVLDGDRPCPWPVSARGWQEDLGLGDDGHRRCELVHDDADGVGWSVRPFSPDDPETGGCARGRVVTEGIELGARSSLMLECMDGG